MQYAIEHPILTFILIIIALVVIENVANNYIRYRLVTKQKKDM